MKGYFLEVDVHYPENLFNLYNHFPFLPERMKKVEKLVENLHDKEKYIRRTENLKQALNHGLVFKKVHKIIKFDQKPWPKRSIDINTNIKNAAKK